VRLIFLGPPAAGKGTQARRLAAEYGMPHISTGDMLRAATKIGSYLGREAKRYMDRGALVPDDVMIGIIHERLQQADCERGFILDGFPRTIPQAEALSELLKSLDTPLDYVVNMEVPVEEVLRRMSGRLTCQNCGSMFNLMLDPPKTPGHCDCCGGPLIHRADDRVETVHERLGIYRQSTKPLIEYYRARGLLKTIDGTGTVDEIAKRIAEAVGGKQPL
jgi:adenylate kinase